MNTTQLMVLPQEVNELAVKVSANKQEEVQTILSQIFIGTDEWEKQVCCVSGFLDIRSGMSILRANLVPWRFQ